MTAELTTGGEVDFELGEWLDVEQMAKAKSRERLTGGPGAVATQPLQRRDMSAADGGRARTAARTMTGEIADQSGECKLIAADDFLEGTG